MSEPLDYHEQGRPGKIAVHATKPLTTQRHLSLAYTPGVAEACRAIASNPADVFRYTAKGNLVAVITNGTAVLGLGDIGPLAGKPVMEGKANLFKKFADIDVFDIELNARTVDEMVAAITALAPTFGGINLEDIKAPECFEVERRLQEVLDIPVFHDDQHGTAIISAAALLNGVKLTGRSLDAVRLVVSGAGAAAMACCRLYVALGLGRENIVMFDSQGALTTARKLSEAKAEFATTREIRDLEHALEGADVFVGLSVANVLSPQMIKGMADRPLIFAMANPDPEIPYEVAREARPDAIIATGRSDYPNQVNNVLGFPFVFRGALDCHARRITEEMKVAATRALAALTATDVPDSVLEAYRVPELKFGPDYIIPKPFDPRVLLWVAPAVAEAAAASGVARRPIVDLEAYRARLHGLVERSWGLMEGLYRRCKASPLQRIVFTDGPHLKVIRAAQVLADEGLCLPILLGPADKIRERAETARVSLRGVEVLECASGELFDRLAHDLWTLRQRKGMTLIAARARLRDRSYFGAMLLRSGMADGLVGGHGRSYRHTLKPALQVLGTEEAHPLVSGVYAMIFGDRRMFFGDCTVNIDPDSDELASIAVNTAEVAETFGATPRVALLSYSDFGEHGHDARVQKVRRAVAKVRELRPDLEVDGEMQADTAVHWDKLRDNFPFSTLTGPANVLIFPDLTSGNVSYKLLEHLASGETVGPLLVGVGRPVNVIPVVASTTSIVNVAAYTAIQALNRR